MSDSAQLAQTHWWPHGLIRCVLRPSKQMMHSSDASSSSSDGWGTSSDASSSGWGDDGCSGGSAAIGCTAASSAGPSGALGSGAGASGGPVGIASCLAFPGASSRAGRARRRCLCLCGAAAAAAAGAGPLAGTHFGRGGATGRWAATPRHMRVSTAPAHSTSPPAHSAVAVVSTGHSHLAGAASSATDEGASGDGRVAWCASRSSMVAAWPVSCASCSAFLP